MARLAIGEGTEIHYRVDDFTDPWEPSEAALLLHGNSESGAAWYRWVPHLGRELRLIRPDMRGFGHSTPMPEHHAWTVHEVVDDYIRLLDHLGETAVHVVAAKISCFVALQFAADHPGRVKSLTLVGPPPSIATLTTTVPSIRLVETEGVEGWARKNMASRLGSTMSPEAIEWWSRYMGRTAASTQIGFMRCLSAFDVSDALSRVKSPALVMAPQSVADEVRSWQAELEGSRLIVLPGDSYHVAVSDADDCAQETLMFIRECTAGRTPR